MYLFFEGECERQLINALKVNPSCLLPGKVKVFNVVQNLIPKSILITIQNNSIVALAFDTDVRVNENLVKNIERLNQYCSRVEIVYLHRF